MTDDLPQYVRARGAVRVRCVATPEGSAAARVRQEGALNVRFPRRERPALDAVLVNVAGGVAAGDHLAVDLTVERGAQMALSTTAAEKVYRSPGDVSRIDVTLAVAGRLDWLPQETILFDQARLARRLHADLSEGASLLAAEIMVLGRAAMGETVVSGDLRDEWRIRREGRLVYADTLRLAGPVRDILARAATGGGAHAFATVLYVAPDAEARLEEARAAIDKLRTSACDVAASAWDGVLAVRWLASDARVLRAGCSQFLTTFRGAPLPRVWMT